MKKFMIIDIKKVFGIMLLVCILIVCGMVKKYSKEQIKEVINQNRLIPIYSVETQEKKVGITFDCAWGADDIDDIIDVLEQNEINATFFAVGTWVDKYEDAIQKLADAGQEIGNHSNSHSHVNNLSYNDNIDDMKKCNEKIEKITNEKVKYYRGPYGEYNNVVIKAAENLNMQVIQWDIDTLDYTGKTPDEMCERIKSKIRNGSIILMHNDTKYTAKRIATNNRYNTEKRDMK